MTTRRWSFEGHWSNFPELDGKSQSKTVIWTTRERQEKMLVVRCDRFISQPAVDNKATLLGDLAKTLRMNSEKIIELVWSTAV